MIYFSILHWIIVSIFLLIFLLLSFLSMKEKKKNVIISMIISSFIVTLFAGVISIYVLDKYTKKVKILSYSTRNDPKHESVIVNGTVKNIGRYKVGYCTLELRISNSMSGRYAKTSYFTPNSSFDFFSSKPKKKNIVKIEKDIVYNLSPQKSKNFVMIARIPAHFEKAKYKLQLFCH